MLRRNRCPHKRTIFLVVAFLMSLSAAAQQTGPARGGDAKNASHYVAGRVQSGKFFPFEPKGSARWGNGPYTLEENLGQEATRARPVDLQPYEGKTIFL